MTLKRIRVGNRTLYYHESYKTWREAMTWAQYYKKEEKSKYYIFIKTDWRGRKWFCLYLHNMWNAI